MNENNNNINSTDSMTNDSQTPLQEKKEEGAGFDIRSFNSYVSGTEDKTEASPSCVSPSAKEAPTKPTNTDSPCTSEPVPECETPTVPPTVPPAAPSVPAPDPEAVAREYKKGAKRRFSYISFMILALNIIYSFAAVLAIGFYEIFAGKEASTTVSMIISALAIAVVGFPFMAIVLSKIKTAEKLPKSNLSLGKLLGFFTVAITGMYGGVFVGNIFSSFLAGIFGNEGDQLVSSSIDGVPIWLIVIFTCIFPGIFEELIFRKLIIDKTKEYGLFVSVIFSGFTFGIFHGNFEQFFYALFVGLLFAYIYAKTGRIIYTIILHATLNFFGSALVLIVDGNDLAMMAYTLVIVIFFIIGIIVLVNEIVDNSKKLKNDVGIRTVGSGNAVMSMILNPGMIVFLVVFAFLFAYMTLVTYGG